MVPSNKSKASDSPSPHIVSRRDQLFSGGISRTVSLRVARSIAFSAAITANGSGASHVQIAKAFADFAGYRV
jgi:hypothetical protein